MMNLFTSRNETNYKLAYTEIIDAKKMYVFQDFNFVILENVKIYFNLGFSL